MSPYQTVAKAALMNWNGLTEEQANQKIQTESVQELENQVYAMNSMKHAVLGITNELGLSEEETKQLWDAVIHGPENAEIFSTVEQKANGFTHEQILNVLSTIHDSWVIDNSSDKAFQEEIVRKQLHQYVPLELIGWNEVRSNLLFLNPILSSIGVSVNENQLSSAYHKRVTEYFEKNNIYDYIDLVVLLGQGKEYYSILPENLEQNLQSMIGDLASQVLSNWEYNDQETNQIFVTRANILARPVNEIISDVQPIKIESEETITLPDLQPQEVRSKSELYSNPNQLTDEELAKIGPDAVITRQPDGQATYYQEIKGEPIPSEPIKVDGPIDDVNGNTIIEDSDDTTLGSPIEDNSSDKVRELMRQNERQIFNGSIPLDFSQGTFHPKDSSHIVKVSPPSTEAKEMLKKLHTNVENLILENNQEQERKTALNQAKAANDEAIRAAKIAAADLAEAKKKVELAKIGPDAVITRQPDGQATYYQEIKGEPIPSEPIKVDGPIDGIDDTMIGVPIKENTTNIVMGLMQQTMQDQMADGKIVGIIDNNRVTFDQNGTIVDVEPIGVDEQVDTSSKTM